MSALRRSSGYIVNQPLVTDALPPQQTPIIRVVIHDTSETETEPNPVPIFITESLSDRLSGAGSNHRARSLPNLADDDDWCRLDVDGKMDCTGDRAARLAVTSPMTSATVSVTSSSQSHMKPSTSSSSSKAKRAASIVEHPVISAVSSS